MRSPAAADPPPPDTRRRACKRVVAALIRRGAHVLLSQRRADQSLPLYWEFPGGKIEPGESAEQALRREIREELGCEVKVGALVETILFAYPDFDLEMSVFACDVAQGTPHPVAVAAVDWVAAVDVPARTLPPADIDFARRLAAGAI